MEVEKNSVLTIAQILYDILLKGADRFAEDCALMIGKKPHIYFRLTWMFVSPVTLIVSIYYHFAAQPIVGDRLSSALPFSIVLLILGKN